ncbi:hypothetical protein DICSQDRAFT_170457 [Dichomitus squalens LYAD-421 SS1]|uniref:DUF6533 domain-containing protein n=1 Tax=Dichomitus squalens (strain LYAD-421) TaxID=732165 RepID=R7SYP8_DICSQ|nr:uncharacterized protein DICSQDRAFT_170457 [Dichomitus squalens LYAD-421 SS1]EJF61304.1 hypothetical protein DICSQDRAFT_170457 [Dichomitus squalens LYAD-421 SS1]
MSQAHLYETTFVETCCDMAAFALVYYECIVTLDREVSLVWGKRFTGATALFLLNRYTAMLKYPIYVVGLTQLSDEVSVCFVEAIFYSMLTIHRVNLLSRVLEIIPYFVWFAFLTLRVYAICGHDWRSAFPVAVAAFMPVASNIYLYSTTYTVNYPLPIGAILSDVLVLAITWWKTHGISKVVKEANLPVSLSSLLLRDGTIYFL